MNITAENIEEWCFRYLEKDLDTDECAFFEKELQTNAALKKEYALWKKTKVTDSSLAIKADLSKILFRFNTQLFWAIFELAVITTTFVVLISAPSIPKHPINQTEPALTPQSVKTNNTQPLSKSIQQKEIPVFRINKKSSDETINLNPETVTVDNIPDKEIVYNRHDSVYMPAEKIIPDRIQSVKDSTVEKREEPKAKNPKRKYQNGSRLIPINNDL